MPRQGFNDFSNSPGSGPSTPRGRGGRGGFGGGRGGGRGGSGPNGSGKKSDYSNVPFDYEGINRQAYVKLEGYSLQPYGGIGSPSQPQTPTDRRGRGGFNPGSRGRGRGFSSPLRGGPQTHPKTPRSAFQSGQATPVTGLGYHEGQETKRSTVGRGGVTWGGGPAPLFVKAGELFKDGEVEVITVDKNGELHGEDMPLSDPSAPQMTDLRDETELELFDVNGLEPQEPMEQPEYPSNGLINGHRDNVEDAQDVASTIEPAQDEAIEPAVSTSTQDDTPLFFLEVDPNPTTILAIPSYDPVSNPPLGTSAYQHSDEEDIVFKPRTYRQPEPISVPMPSIVPIPVPSTTPYFPAAAYIDPRARTRRDKKAAKRDKGGRKKKGRRKQVVIEGSDIEWGSDGPPGEIFGVEGLDDGNQDEGEGEGDGDDVEVLRDYLEGTLLNAKTEQEERDEEMRQDEVESDEDSEVDRAMEKEVERLFGDGGTNGAAGITEAFQVGEDEKGDEGGGEDEGEGDEGDWESSSGSGDSSDLGNIKVALAEVGSDSDEDVEDEVDLFAGKDSWDETDWFIRSMEEALDGTGTSVNGQKTRNHLFTAIENGDFDDFWPTAPAKKAKNKHVPPELQRQWEKDRQKKAQTKRQRDLDRLAAEFDPFPASRKGKGRSKAFQASLAHLIPPSAAVVAEMFDISSEEFLAAPPGRMALPKPLEQVDQDIRSFLGIAGKNAYSLPPMDKEGRKKIHMLAECYGLKSKSRGKGRARFTVLIKTARSGDSIDEVKVQRLVSASTFSGGKFYKALHSRSGGGGGGKVKKAGGSGGGGGVRHREGDQVGEGAERIGGDNVGYKLLSMMGWVEGDRIGRTGGLDSPIVAIVKNTKMGLGA